MDISGLVWKDFVVVQKDATVSEMIGKLIAADQREALVFDKDKFQQEVENTTGKAAKADKIASRTSKHISEKMEEDPAFYKKFSQMLKETIGEINRNRLMGALNTIMKRDAQIIIRSFLRRASMRSALSEYSSTPLTVFPLISFAVYLNVGILITQNQKLRT